MTSEVECTIWMIWKNDQDESFKVGELSRRSGKYYFNYDIDGVKRAQEYGFSPLPYFPKLDAEYFREELFRTFSKRLPGHGKKSMPSVLKEYKLRKYDDLELLKRSGGKMSTDSIEFVASIEEEYIIVEEE